MISFLAEAAAQATRRPHEAWELAQTLIAESGALDGRCDSHGVSGLAVCCLRNARKVAASTRMPAEARSAISEFTAGVYWWCCDTKQQQCRGQMFVFIPIVVKQWDCVDHVAT